MRLLETRDYLVFLPLLTSVLGDYQGYSNYVYPEAYSFPDNTSLASYSHYHNQPTQGSRRLLDQGLLTMTAGECNEQKEKVSFFGKIPKFMKYFTILLDPTTNTVMVEYQIKSLDVEACQIENKQ